MQNMEFDLQTQETLSSLAHRLNTSEEEVLKEAVYYLAKEINQKENVMEIAGITEDDRQARLEHL